MQNLKISLYKLTLNLVKQTVEVKYYKKEQVETKIKYEKQI